MKASVANESAVTHRVITDVRPEMARADLRSAEKRDLLAGIGSCLDYARSEVRWNLDELAAALKRDARQVRRWIAGEERTQVDVVFGVPELRAPFVIALARLAEYDVVTRIEIRKLG